MKIIFSLFLSLFIYHKSIGQYTHLGSWNILNIRYDVGDKWSLFAEGQVRSLHFYNWFHYHEYKAGIIWHNRPGMHIALGMGDYDTYKEGGNFVTPKNNDEFRLWPQLTFDQKLGKVKMETRYRAELRFQESGFRERFRQRILFSLPLASKTSVSFSNEIFFTTREPYFERNRVALNFNQKLSPSFSIMLGYLHQFDYRINDETGRDFLQVGGYFVFDK